MEKLGAYNWELSWAPAEHDSDLRTCCAPAGSGPIKPIALNNLIRVCLEESLSILKTQHVSWMFFFYLFCSFCRNVWLFWDGFLPGWLLVFRLESISPHKRLLALLLSALHQFAVLYAMFSYCLSERPNIPVSWWEFFKYGLNILLLSRMNCLDLIGQRSRINEIWGNTTMIFFFFSCCTH